MPLKVRVNADRCVGHGRCYEIAPEVFLDDERGHCRIENERVPAEHEAAARRAEANCPENAIEVIPE
jgi:ferredoxin